VLDPVRLDYLANGPCGVVPGNDAALPSSWGSHRLPVSFCLPMRRLLNKMKVGDTTREQATFCELPQISCGVFQNAACDSLGSNFNPMSVNSNSLGEIIKENIELRALVLRHTITLTNAQQALISCLEQNNAQQPHDYAQPAEPLIFTSTCQEKSATDNSFCSRRVQQTTASAAGRQASANARLGRE